MLRANAVAKCHQGDSVNSEWFRNGSENIGLWYPFQSYVTHHDFVLIYCFFILFVGFRQLTFYSIIL